MPLRCEFVDTLFDDELNPSRKSSSSPEGPDLNPGSGTDIVVCADWAATLGARRNPLASLPKMTILR
jgi:hypothetical protein